MHTREVYFVQNVCTPNRDTKEMCYTWQILSEEMDIVSTCRTMMTSSFPRYRPFVWGIHRPSQRPVSRSFDVFYDLCLNKCLSKQSRRRCFGRLLRSLWRHFIALFLNFRLAYSFNNWGNYLWKHLWGAEMNTFPLASQFEWPVSVCVSVCVLECVCMRQCVCILS